jgi:hypothetical protein
MMPRHELTLPLIDYGTGLVFPNLSNSIDNFQLPEKFARWGSLSASDSKTIPLHGFVDDWRLEAIWRDDYKGVSKIINQGLAVAPDFTIEIDTPAVYAFYQCWRSRVVARYWQDCGIFSIPALQWSRPELNRHLFKGLQNCDVVAVRSPTKGSQEQWRQCAERFLVLNSPKLVLHFGTKAGLDVWHNAINLNLRG